MRKSEIFEEFAKIAQENKIISNDSSKSFRKLENNPRADSLDISAIEALYGVKPKSPENMNYKNNIMEVAHPKSLVISPANDRLNGLVENNIERQNINLRIVNKNPDGLLTQRKYARRQLLLSLTRVANDLDNKNQIKLANLTDNCLKNASKNFTLKKEAGIFGTITYISLVIGLIYAYNHSNFTDEGFDSNHKNLIKEIDDIIKAKISWGYGEDYTPKFKQQMSQFKSRVEKFKKIYDGSRSFIEKLDDISSAKALEARLKDQVFLNKLVRVSDKLEAEINKLLPELELVDRFFQDEDFKKRQIVDKGILTRVIDKPGILHRGTGLFGDDFDDIRQILPTYIESIKNISQRLKNFSVQKDMAKEKAEEQLTKQEQQSAPPIFSDDKNQKAYQDDASLGDLFDQGAQTATDAAKQKVQEYAKDKVKETATDALTKAFGF